MSTTGDYFAIFLMLGAFISFGVFMVVLSILYPHGWRG